MNCERDMQYILSAAYNHTWPKDIKHSEPEKVREEAPKGLWPKNEPPQDQKIQKPCVHNTCASCATGFQRIQFLDVDRSCAPMSHNVDWLTSWCFGHFAKICSVNWDGPLSHKKLVSKK